MSVMSCSSDHSSDNVESYIVRHTVDVDGTRIVNDKGTVGVDVYEVGPFEYYRALVMAKSFREGKSYAVIDALFECGCRF